MGDSDVPLCRWLLAPALSAALRSALLLSSRKLNKEKTT